MPTATKQTTTKVDIQKLSALYDRIYDIADGLLKKHNPCNIHSDGTKSSCQCHLHTTHRIHLCCTGCKYISPTGCTVKALACKLFLCPSIKNKVLQKRFYKLREYVHKYLSFDYYGIDGCKWNCNVFSFYYKPKECWLKLMEKIDGTKSKKS